MNDYARAPNQPLLTTSSPTFAGLTINGAATFAATVTVSGVLTVDSGSHAAPGIRFTGGLVSGFHHSGTQVFIEGGNISAFAAGNSGSGSPIVLLGGEVAFYDGQVNAGTPRTYLVADAAGNILSQRNGLSAQKFRVYNTYTDAGENEYFEIRSNVGAEYQLISVANGTGTARAISILPGGSNGWSFVGNKLLPSTTGDFSIGATTQRVKDILLGGNTPAASAPMIDCSQTWNDAGVAFVGVNWAFTNTASAAGARPLQISIDGTPQFYVGMPYGNLHAEGGVEVGSGAQYTFVSRGVIAASANGVFVFNTTSGGDFGRLCLGGAEAGYGAIARDGAGIKVIAGDGTTGAFLSGVEQTAPAAPAANGYRIYAEDNGAGKTRLMCVFGSGAPQQLAIEP